MAGNMSKTSGIKRSGHKKSYDLLGQYDGYFFALGKRKHGECASIIEQELKENFEQQNILMFISKPYESEDEDGIMPLDGAGYIDHYETLASEKIFTNCNLCNAEQKDDRMVLVGEGYD